MRDIASESVNGRGYNRVTLDRGDTLECVCLYFGYDNWRNIYLLNANADFRIAYPLETVSNSRFSEYLDSPTFYIPQPSGSSGASAITRLGPVETYCRQIEILERAESNATTLVTYIRKIYYDSSGWNSIIPQARNVRMPVSMAERGDVALAVQYISEHQVLPVDGREVDIGHFFTGLDARNRPERPLYLGPTLRDIQQRLERQGIRIDLDEVRRRLGSDFNIRQDTNVPIFILQDNQRVATWSPDIGSAVAQYLHGTLGQGRTFNDYYNNWASDSDMRGNADSYVFPFSSGQTLSQQFRSYYRGTSSQRTRRFAEFRRSIGMANTDAWKNPVIKDVLNSALGYAQSEGWNTDVAAILLNRTIRGGVSGWLLEHFASDLGSALQAWEDLYRSASRLGVEVFIRRTTSATY